MLKAIINNVLLIICPSLVGWITLIVLIVSPLESSTIAKSKAPGRPCLDFRSKKNNCQNRECEKLFHCENNLRDCLRTDQAAFANFGSFFRPLMHRLK